MNNKNVKLFLLFCLITLSNSLLGQERFNLRGVIRDEKGNSISEATVVVKELSNKWTISNDSGEYEFKLEAGTYTLIASYIGYNEHEQKVILSKNCTVDIIIKETSLKMEEVVVSSVRSRDRIANIQIGAETIALEELAKTPAFLGENDIIKSITYLPGVRSQGDGQSGFQVRGGSASQNLILLDNNPVYSAGHILGLFSVFNDDAIATATLYKGLVPAQYGGGGSSVFDIGSKKGDLQKYNVSADIGLLLSKATIDGPIAKDKASFSVSARRSYFDLFLKLTDEFENNIANFHDINANIYYRPSENDAITLSFFNGRDKMALESFFTTQWENTNGNMDWFHRYNKNLISHTSVIYSNFLSENVMEIGDIENILNGFINTYSLKHEFKLSKESHDLSFGLQSSYYDTKSADWTTNGVRYVEQRQAWENSIWVNDEFTISPKLSLSAGLRLSSFSALGGAPYYRFDSKGEIIETINYEKGEFVKTNFTLEPRFSANYMFHDNHSVKAGYARLSQNVYNIQNSSIMVPFFRYTMTSNNLKPLITDQVSLGYVAITNDEMFEFSIEGYYKKMKNVYDYKDGKQFSSDIIIENIVLGGDGRSYGGEFLAKKNRGKFTGWIAYTLSKTESKIDGINNNEWYTATNDVRHDISVVGMYNIGKNWEMSATWVYNTGQALTAPSAKYEIGGVVRYYYAERNGYRAPDYHRLDISFTNTKKLKNYTRSWSFGAYNLYNRYNPYIISFEDDPSSVTGTSAIQTSLFGIIPSVTFGIKF